MRSCKEITRLASEGLDSKLPLGQQIELRLHLLLCPPCRRYVAQLRAIRGFLRETLYAFDNGLPTGEHKLTARAKERLKRTLNGSQEG